MPLPRLRRADAVAALGVAVLVLFAFWEVAFGGRTFSASAGVPGVNGSDPPTGYVAVPRRVDIRVDGGASAWQFEPWARVVHDELRQGRVPLWNPYQGAGAPLAANMQTAVFDPLLLPVHLHPTLRVWDLTFLSLFVLGAIATYAFARVLGLGTLASTTAAGAFVLTGYFMLYSNNQFFRVYLYLPVLLGLVEAVLRGKGRLPVAFLAAAVACTVLAGMPEAALFVLALTGAFAAYRLLSGPRRHSRPVSVARLGGGVALGLALTAPLLLPFGEYLRVAFHTHSARHGLVADPVSKAFEWVVPHLRQLPPPSSSPVARGWVGMAVPMLGAVAAGSPSVMRRHHGWFFGMCGAVLLLKQYGAPLVQWMGALPLARESLFPPFATPVAAFCLAMLAAVGVQAIEEGAVRRRRLVGAVLLLVLLVAGVLFLGRDAMTGDTRSHLLGQLGIAGAGALLVVVAASSLPRVAGLVLVVVVLGAESMVLDPASGGGAKPWSTIVLAAGAAVILAVVVLRVPRAGAAIAAVAVLAELLLLVPRGIYLGRADPYARPPWMAMIAHGTGPGRPDRVYGLGGKFYPDTAAAFAVQDVRALDALFVRRYVDYVHTFVEPEFWDRLTGAEATRPNMEDNPMWDLLGVRYVLAPDAEGLDPFLNRLFAATRETDALGAAPVAAGGDVRPAVVMRGSQAVTYPVYETEPRRISFSYSLLPGTSSTPAAGGRLSIEGASSAGRVPLWSADVAGPATGDTWTHVSVDLPDAARSVTGLVLRSEGFAGSDAAWAGLEVVGQEGAPAAGRLRSVGAAGGVQVVEDTGRMPRAFVVHRVHRVATQEEALARLTRGQPTFADGAVRVARFDPAREAVVEAAQLGNLRLPPGDSAAEEPLAGGVAARRPAAGGAGDSGPAETRVVSYAADRVEISVRTARPGLLVLTDVFFPGWRATVNGRATEVLPADVAFRAVPVGAGASTVVFTYRPASFRTGLAVAATAAAAVAVWLIATPGRSRLIPHGRAGIAPLALI